MSMEELSGRFVLRIPPDLHARVRKKARNDGVSLNEYCRTAIEYYTDGQSGRRISSNAGSRWVDEARRVVGDDLDSVVLFGSRARSDDRASSDIDLLVVVRDSLELSRELYHRWDRIVLDRLVNPHFVHLPKDISTAGSLWFEIALDGIVLHDENQKTNAFLRALRLAIANGRLQRRHAHGHPYWVKQREAANA